MPTHYDPNALLQFADELYQKAKGIVRETAVYYGVITFFASFFLFSGLPSLGLIPGPGPLLILGITATGILSGVSAGRKKAFAMKLHAQQILCQIQIEANMRQKYIAISPGH